MGSKHEGKQTSSSRQQGKKTRAYTDDVSLVAAFDFGTTYSGYAYLFTIEKDKIILNESWEGVHTYKTSTAVLLDPNGVFDSFGYDAERKYANLEPSAQQSYKLFSKFKMTLNTENLYGKEVKVRSQTGEERNAVEIFAYALQSMIERLDRHIDEMHKSKDDNVKWVITVPAIWSEGAKQFMRQVALKAGLIQDLNSPRLVIALEPEAAAIYYRNQIIHKFNKETKGQTLPVGIEYVILDCGGGTIDVTAHKVIGEESIEEIYRATGGPWGGENVNKNFEKLIVNLFGEDFIKHYIKTWPGQWYELSSAFEINKRNIASLDGNIKIPINADMPDQYRDYSNAKIQYAIKKAAIPGVTYESGKIDIKGKALEGLFKPVVDKTISHLHNLLQNDQLKNITHIILVGGFSNSPYLKNAVKTEFEGPSTGKTYRVLPAMDAEVAVMKGAVMYGTNPPVIKSRIAKYTYGYEVNTLFQPNHDKSRKYFNTHKNAYYCKGFVDVLITQGESVNFGDVLIGTCYPSKPDQTEVLFRFLAADKKSVTYADEEGVMELGQLTYKSEDTTKGLDRSFKVKYTFGDTEIKVSVSEEGNSTVALKLTGLANEV